MLGNPDVRGVYNNGTGDLLALQVSYNFDHLASASGFIPLFPLKPRRALLSSGGKSLDEILGYETDGGVEGLEAEGVVEAAVGEHVDGALGGLNRQRRVRGDFRGEGVRGGAGRRKSWLKASPGNCLMGPMPGLSQNWSVPFSPRAALCCAMDNSTGPAPTTSSNHPRDLGFTSTELPNERWRRWASQRASSSL